MLDTSDLRNEIGNIHKILVHVTICELQRTIAPPYYLVNFFPLLDQNKAYFYFLIHFNTKQDSKNSTYVLFCIFVSILKSSFSS